MIPLPRLTTRNSWLIGAGIFGVIVLVGAVAFVTQPEHRAAAVVAPVLISLVLVAMMVRTMELDTTHGAIVTTRLGLLRRRLDLATVTRLAIGPNNANQAMLGLKGDGKSFVSLVHCSPGVNRSLDPGTLTALADAVDAFVPAAAAGRGDATTQLRAQAAHVGRGGTAQDSPLASYATESLAKAAAGPSIFTMLD